MKRSGTNWGGTKKAMKWQIIENSIFLDCINKCKACKRPK